MNESRFQDEMLSGDLIPTWGYTPEKTEELPKNVVMG